MTIKIDIKRTGFPVHIGSLELWFDSSIENLKNFVNVEKIAQEKLKKAQELAKHVHFPDEITVENINEVKKEDVDVAFSANKEFIAAQYDIVFGDGAFKKIYEEYPDIIALENAMDPLFLAISDKIAEQEEERLKEVEGRKNAYLEKQKLKQVK